MIAWEDLLQDVFEFIVNLPTPNNFWKRDLEFISDTPLSATADAAMTLINSGSIDRVNTDMHMNVKWRLFRLRKVIPGSSQVRMTPCPHFFAAFISQNVNV